MWNQINLDLELNFASHRSLQNCFLHVLEIRIVWLGIRIDWQPIGWNFMESFDFSLLIQANTKVPNLTDRLSDWVSIRHSAEYQ